MAQKSSLGKGLGSLFTQPMLTPETSEPPIDSIKVILLPTEKIQTNQVQPRKQFETTSLYELSESIKQNGILQPLIVRRLSDKTYELIAGERRLRAAKLAGLETVPVLLRTHTTDKESLALALVENIQRENLNCVDEALAYMQLIEDFHFSIEQVAQKIGKDPITITNILRILKLPPTMLQDLRAQLYTLGHAKALLGLETTDQKIFVRNEICEKKLSVRETEQLVNKIKQGVKKQDPSSQESLKERLQILGQELTRLYASKVELKGTEKKGKIVIHYGSQKELDRILDGLRAPKL